MKKILFTAAIALILVGCAARRPTYNVSCGAYGLCKTVPFPHRIPPRVHR